MENELLLSIIVPAFNVEKYLGNCLDSIYNQKINEHLFEVICVNDRSNDDTLNILLRYKAIHDNIVIINNKKNKGLSFSRNIAMKQAKGKYLMFIDSDDLILPNKVQQLLNTAETDELDYLEFGYKEIRPKESPKITYSPIPTDIMTGVEFFISNVTDIRVMTVMKLYRREFLNSNNITFPNGLIHEDNYFDFISLMKAKRVKAISDIVYVYQRRENSITSGTSPLIEVENISEILNRVRNFIVQEDYLHKDKILYDACIWYCNSLVRTITNHYKKIEYIRKDYNYEFEAASFAIMWCSQRYNGFFARKLPPTIIDEIKRYEAIVIYGGGNVGKGLKTLLSDYGIIDTHIAVSKNNNDGEYLITDFNSDNSIILIASKNYEEEMYENAITLGFKHIVRLREYF